MTSIGYVMRDFPVLYHATVLNEIRVLRSLGHNVRVFSILEPHPSEHRGMRPEDLPPTRYAWKVRAPFAQVMQSNAAILARVGPGAYRRAYEMAQRGAILLGLKSFMRLAHWAEEMRRQGVEHLHAHWATEATTVALIFSWLTRLPFSFTAHAYDIYLRPQFFDLKLREASFAVTVSQYNRRYIAEHFGPDHINKIHVIYPLIDLSRFPPRSAPPHGPLTIVTVGRLTEYKGLRYLVKACRILKDRGVDVDCQIVGQGEDEQPLREAIARLGLESHVRLLGTLPHEAIPPLLETATLFALPCVIADNGDRDGMPLVLIEAMARGLPVVSSEIIGLPELVRDGAGLLVPPRDPVALADAIQRLAHMSPEARDEMGRAGRRIVEDFDAAKGTARLIELIHGVERSGRDRRPAVNEAPEQVKPVA